MDDSLKAKLVSIKKELSDAQKKREEEEKKRKKAEAEAKAFETMMQTEGTRRMEN